MKRKRDGRLVGKTKDSEDETESLAVFFTLLKFRLFTRLRLQSQSFLTRLLLCFQMNDKVMKKSWDSLPWRSFKETNKYTLILPN